MSAPVSLQIVAGLLLFALVFIPLERCFPVRRQNVFRAGWITDVAYYVAGCFLSHLSDAISLGAMLLLRDATGLNMGRAAAQPGWLQFLEILIVADFCAYLFHRALHRNAWLWRFHRIHHSSARMDWLANVRLHPIDKLLGECFQFIPLFCIGFGNGPMLAYTIFLGCQSFLNHSNVRLNFGPLRWLFASPQFHHWHHCNQPDAYNTNFSQHFVIFDLLFGTAYIPPPRCMPTKYGVAESVPDGFYRQLIHPFGLIESSPRSKAANDEHGRQEGAAASGDVFRATGDACAHKTP